MILVIQLMMMMNAIDDTNDNDKYDAEDHVMKSYDDKQWG